MFRILGEVVGVFYIEAEASPVDGHDILRYRIELIRHHEPPCKIGVRAWRMEFYRIQPTFPQAESVPSHDPCDEVVLVEEHGLLAGIPDLTGDYGDMQTQVIQYLSSRLGH